MVHGDLKGVRDRFKSSFTAVLTFEQVNILMDATCHARITDIGLGMATQNVDSAWGTWTGDDHSARWTAPEILNEQGTYSKRTDIFSFAMVMIEVRCDPPSMLRASVYTS